MQSSMDSHIDDRYEVACINQNTNLEDKSRKDKMRRGQLSRSKHSTWRLGSSELSIALTLRVKLGLDSNAYNFNSVNTTVFTMLDAI